MINLQDAEKAEGELNRLQQAAALAPTLRAQQAQQQAQDQHRQAFFQAENASKVIVQKALLTIPRQRQEFLAWVEQGLKLGREMGLTQAELGETLARLTGHVRAGLGRAANEGQQITLDGQVHAQATSVFQRIGAMDPRLELLPPSKGAHKFAVACLALMAKFVTSIFEPGRGPQQFWKTRLTSMIENKQRQP